MKETSKPGYKSTPLGLIPEDWEVDLLEHLAKRRSGHTPDKEFPEYYNGGIKWISLADSHRLDNGLVLETEIEISQEGLNNSSAVLLPAGTVVMSRDAGVGKSGVMAEPMAVSQHFIAWTCNGKFDNWFLYYWLQLRKEYFERQAVGSTIKTIGLPLFKKLQIVNPPLAEQRKIAAILSTWDAAIAAEEKLIVALQARHRALMQRLLTGRQRLKGFEGEWKEVRLADVFNRVTRKNTTGNKTVVTISAQRGFVRQTEFFNKSIASEILDDYHLVRRGEFCYNKSYSNGYEWGATKRLDEFEEAVVTTLYICFGISNTEAADSDFFNHFFEWGGLNKGLMKIAHEGGRAHGLLNVTPSDFFNLKVVVPSVKEQQAIASVLTTSRKQIAVHRKRLATLQSQKKGLMQVLLTGKVRVANTQNQDS